MQSGNAQTQSAMPPQFTPDEVVEILTEAVNLSSQYVSLAQLEAIADEAGIPRETLYQVIRKRAEQSNKQVQSTLDKQLRRQQRIQRWKSRLKKLGLTILILTLGVAAISISYDLGYQDGRGRESSSYWSYGNVALPYFEDLTDESIEQLAIRKIRGKTIHLYILPRIYFFSHSSYISSIWMKHSSSGSLEPIYKTSGNITRATLSPNERLLAFVITGSASEGVWVLDLQTNESHRISSDPFYGFDIAWVDDRTLILPTDNGRYRCELNERGVPLRYKPLGE
jgi:hypothetical protein